MAIAARRVSATCAPSRAQYAAYAALPPTCLGRLGRLFRSHLVSWPFDPLYLRVSVPPLNEFETPVLSVPTVRFLVARLLNDFDLPVPGVPNRCDARGAA